MILILLVLLLPAMSTAQTVTGTLQGTAQDPTGGVLPGTTVGARNPDTGQTRETVTNAAGYYVLPFLPIGRYQVTAALAGFRTVVHEQVTIALNDTRVIDFTLAPASVAETVTVWAEAPPINVTNGEIKHGLNERQIDDRPTANHGSFLALAETFAGFAENPTSGQNNPTSSSGSSINFNGTGTRGATFQINGVNNDDSSENQHRQGVALATIQEFQVITNTYSAEFGRGFGAVVLVQTKSGTNQPRGETYEYAQHSAWNAQSAFALAKPNNQRDQFGLASGFPLRQNTLFGFVGVDHKRFAGNLTYTRDLFLPSELSLPRLTRGNDTPANRAFIDAILARFPAGAVPNDPRSPRTYQTRQTIDQPAEDDSFRADWTPGHANTVTARYQYTKQLFASDDIIVGEQALQNNRQGNVGVTWTHVLGPSTTSELRYGLGLRHTRVDIAAGNDTPIVRFSNSPVSGTTIGNAGTFPIHRDQTDHQIVGNVTTLFGGSHQLKSGVDVRFQQLDDLADSNSRGVWTFNAVCGGVTYPNSYLAFLDGCIANFQTAYGPFFLENRMNEYNAYAEDNWRLRSNLTLNLGVRYELVQAPSEVQDRIAYGIATDRNNVEPRLGFAWSPSRSEGWLGRLTGGPGAFSIRGGFGLYDGRIFQSVFSQGGASLRTNPPNALARTITTQPEILNVSDPTLGFVFVPGPQTVRHSITIASPDLEMPRTQQWNLTVERRMPWNSSLRVSYTGTRGLGQLRYAQSNLPLSPTNGPVLVVNHPNNAPAAGFPDLRGRTIDRIAADVNCAGTGLPNIVSTAACPQAVPIADNEISLRVPRTNERRADPRYTTNLVVSNDAQTWYDGLQVEWIHRLAAGLWFQTSYTYSVSEDTTSEATAVGAGDSNQLGPDKRFARGYSRFHTPHRYTFNGSYRLPFLRDRADLAGSLLGGWTVSGILRLAHGTPFTVTDTARDLNFDGFAENRPILLDPSILGLVVGDPATSTQILARDKFRTAQYGEGDLVVGRNTFFGDGQASVDAGLYKTFRLPWQHTFTVRVEAFNAFNSVQYGFPTADISNANFGRVLTGATAYAARTLQLGLQYKY